MGLFFDQLKKHSTFGFFVLFYLILTFLTFRDYGITWDEKELYFNGSIYLGHYFHMNSEELEQSQILSKQQASHNYLYAALAWFGSHYLSFKPTSNWFAARYLDASKLHLFNMLFALLPFWVLFEVLLSALKNKWLALLGPVTLYLTLRFSGDIPANPSDMPLAVMYTVSLASFYFYRRVPWNINLQDILLGSLIGFTSSVRVLGITLLPILALIRFLDFWLIRPKQGQTPFLNWLLDETPHWLVIFIVSQFWMMALWPYLGSNYFGNYFNIFHVSKSYDWGGTMMFMGEVIHAGQKPWSYLPVWLGVSMPIFVMVFFFYSSWFFWKTEDDDIKRSYLVFAVPIFFNLPVYFILRPLIYNGLRHYLFLLPLFCTLAAIGLAEFLKQATASWLKKGILALVTLNVVLILIQLFQLYPYQYIYLNELVGGVKEGGWKFDTDYWGASIKEAAQWLAANELTDPGKKYRVEVCAAPWQSTEYFPPNAEARYEDEIKELEYRPQYRIILHSETVVPPHKLILTPELKNKVIYTVKREGVPLAYVLKLTPPYYSADPGSLKK